MQSKNVIDLVTRNIKELVAPNLEKRLYEYSEVEIEDELTWRFYKIVRLHLIYIHFDTTYEDHVKVEFCCPSSNYSQITLDELDPELDVWTGVVGFRFHTEEELRQVLNRLLRIVLEHEEESIEKMLSKINLRYQDGSVKWDGTQWKDCWGEVIQYRNM